MSMSEPRLRSLLRQAERTQNAGKRAAAAQLYRDIVAEAPEVVEAWLNLAELSEELAEKTQAYEQVLALAPGNAEARAFLAGEPLPAKEPVVVADVEVETAVSPLPSLFSRDKMAETAVDDEAFLLTCYRHPDRETSLRCYNCDKPICIDCANKTPVGYICPDCRHSLQEKFFSASPIDYVVATVISFILSLAAGFIVVNFGGGFFWVLIVLFVAGGVGSFVAKLTNRALGKRRGRYIPHVVAAMVVLGVVIPALPLLLGVLFGGLGGLFGLLVPGIYAFVASSSAFYWMR